MKGMRKVRRRSLIRLRRQLVKRKRWPFVDWGPPWKKQSRDVAKTHRYVYKLLRPMREAHRRTLRAAIAAGRDLIGRHTS